MAQYRCLRVNTRDGVVVVRFVDPWATNDLARGGLGKELLALVAQEDCSRFLLNCGELTYICSAMLGKLIELHKEVEAKGGKLVLCELTPTVHQVFTMTKLDKVLDVRDTERDAFNAFE